MNLKLFVKVVTRLPKTLYFNFHYLPFKQAIRLPIIFCSGVKLIDLHGEVKLVGPIHTGMVLLGWNGNALYQQNSTKCVWANHGGICTFSDKDEFNTGLAIEIGKYGMLSFGENVLLGPMVRISCFDSVSIEANSRIAWESIILDTDFHSTINTETGGSSPLTKPIRIGKNNWLGIRNFIMKGVETPDFCISSAYSLLNKKYDVPNYSLIGGVPAKFIKDGLFRDLSSNIFNNRYIVNADDFGISDEVNAAIDSCMKNNSICTTSILANGVKYNEAIEKAYIGNYSDKIGFHFNLTEGKPLSDEICSCKRFVDANSGNFIYKRNSLLFLTNKEKKGIKAEFSAQYNKLKESGLAVRNFDSHQHVHTELPIFKVIADQLINNNILIIRLAENCNTGSSWIKRIYKNYFNAMLHRKGFLTVDYFTSYFDNSSENMPKNSNQVELMIHPITRNGEIWDSVENVIIQNKKLPLIDFSKLYDRSYFKN